MNEYLLLLIAAVGLIVCVANWRIGFLLCVLVGCVQDPIRKLIPDQPVFITSTIILFVVATGVGAYLRGRRFGAY